MTKLNVYTSKGTKRKSKVTLPKEMQEDKNMMLLAQAIRVYEDRQHNKPAKVKTRSEVRASTRKIYRQKGTGRARHGAISAPIFVGGGKAHGPDGLKRKLKLPKKMKRKALKIALSLKASEGKLIALDKLDGIKKTKDASSLIDKIAKKEKNIEKDMRFLLALFKMDKNARLAFRNLQNVDTVPFSDLNAYSVFFADAILVDKEVLKDKKSSKKKKTKSKSKSAKKKKS